MHRDIKPENILFRKKGDLESLCLGDFGLADIYKKDGKYLFTRCGTPGFVAPELLQD
jgi:calcium/calmodulin-dependent protein kinase I